VVNDSLPQEAPQAVPSMSGVEIVSKPVSQTNIIGTSRGWIGIFWHLDVAVTSSDFKIFSYCCTLRPKQMKAR